MNSHGPKLLIFDLDGTLVDSAPDITLAVNALLHARCKAPLPAHEVVRAIGYGLKKTVFQLFPESHSTPEALEQLEAEFLFYYEKHLLGHTQPFAGVLEFLRALGPEVQIAIVTNKYAALAQRLIAHSPLAQFDWIAIFGFDSLERSKPDPLPLLEVMRLAKVSTAQTVMIGDGLPDMQAAQAAGVKSIACSFGYTNLADLKSAGAAATIDAFSELSSVLNSLFGAAGGV